MTIKYNDMLPDRLACLKAVATAHISMNHEDPAMLPFLDDNSTLREPDTFNQCHDAGWLSSAHDDRTDCSYVRLTDSGRTALTSHVRQTQGE